jgi:hypothetical protein
MCFVLNYMCCVQGPRDDVLWTWGWEQFIREHRHEICIDVTRQRMGSLACKIVTLMLQKGLSTEMGVAQSHSAPMGLMDVCDMLRAMDEGSQQQAVDMQTVRQVMELMRCDGVGIVSRVAGSETKDRGVMYMVSISGTLHII